MSSRRRVLWFIIWCLVTVEVIVYFLTPKAFRSVALLATYAAGRATGCPFSTAMNPIGDELDALRSVLASQVEVVGQDGDLALVRTPHGEFWTPRGTDISFLLAEQLMDLYSADDRIKGIRAGDVVLDCGANIGTFVRHALKAGASQVIAIEISPRNLKSLNRTFSDEIADGRVVVVPEGVWHEEATLQLSVFGNSALDSVVMRDRIETAEAGTLIDVPLTTIDAIVSRLGLERVDFIKMDIEGAETNALRGAAETLRTFRPRLAIAAENLPDDVTQVPLVVAEAVDDYTVDPGECRVIRPFLVRPEVLNFY